MWFQKILNTAKRTWERRPNRLSFQPSVGRPPVDEDELAESVETVYDQDGLRSIHNHEFMRYERFQRSYQRGVQAAGADYSWHWRVHVGLWAAASAALLDGDFVECGVNRGFMASAIMEYLRWNRLGKRFFLLDTFSGIDMRYVSQEELNYGIVARNDQAIESGFYTLDVESVRRNFAEWSGIALIAGAIPDTLPQIETHRIAFIHMDLNCSPPEFAAIEYLWDKLVPGALVLFDDYAYRGFRVQKIGIDRFARSQRIEVLSLPTGQGLLIKPPS